MKKMISWNVNGLRACVGKGFLDVFHELDADIFCIQESKLQEGQIDLELPGYYQYWSYAEKKGYSGTALFSKEEPLSVSYGLGIEKHDHEGRVITAEYPDYYVVTCYTPNSQNELARLPYRMQWEDDFRQFLKKLEEKKHKGRPSEQALHYLYILLMDGRKMKQNLEQDKAYLLDKMSKMTGDFSIYGKARAAVVLARNSQQNAAYREKAGEYLQSVNEYAVYREEMGRYYDTRKALYSWRNYKIPTQVSVIEALQMLKPNDKQTIEELQRWLLMSKRTQVWDTPVNTVDAVYAFMKGNESNWSRRAENAVLKLDGKQLPMPQDSTTLGYVKTEKTGKASKLSIDKKSDYTSWGAVYAEFKQPISEIGSMESGIKVRRVIVPAESESKGNAQVGEKVKVTLIITADRDYDFVQITDKRAACLEPVNQLSGYQWSIGCYVSPRDHATNFYFDRLSKGKHIVEMEYYVDRKGDYQSGTCTAECTYSPEFGGRTETYELKVNN